VYLGFRPKYLIVKGSDVVRGWNIWDSVRSPYNALDTVIFANLSSADSSGGYTAFDFLSNGFKLRNTSADWNNSGSTYVYAAFAESPFKYALAR
jgi:hypothetical protein